MGWKLSTFWIRLQWNIVNIIRNHHVLYLAPKCLLRVNSHPREAGWPASMLCSNTCRPELPGRQLLDYCCCIRKTRFLYGSAPKLKRSIMPALAFSDAAGDADGRSVSRQKEAAQTTLTVQGTSTSLTRWYTALVAGATDNIDKFQETVNFE